MPDPDFTPELLAAYAFVEAMVPRADVGAASYPLWHGWALREAYLAGARAERDRLRAVLRSVEWEGDRTASHGPPDFHCPACAGRKTVGHAHGCALAAALKGG